MSNLCETNEFDNLIEELTCYKTPENQPTSVKIFIYFNNSFLILKFSMSNFVFSFLVLFLFV